ncbi:pentatricopeptide repeat-containing protein [Canna indica]|uniref:Pentatricopeptide repeat-containing protein n=1 Tax=Canna indica TaxID=4628 RepID=A0AAQ3QDC7_9LILI|nr:pentatricopeptide repeat-containing protein [Canna indica]
MIMEIEAVLQTFGYMAPEYENSEFLSSSPRSPTKLVFSELHSKGGGGGGGGGRPLPTSPKHMRLSHSGKLVRVKKESCDSMLHLKQIHARLTTTGLMSRCFPARRVLAFGTLPDPGDMAHAVIVFRQIPHPNP